MGTLLNFYQIPIIQDIWDFVCMNEPIKRKPIRTHKAEIFYRNIKEIDYHHTQQ